MQGDLGSFEIIATEQSAIMLPQIEDPDGDRYTVEVTFGEVTLFGRFNPDTKSLNFLPMKNHCRENGYKVGV